MSKSRRNRAFLCGTHPYLLTAAIVVAAYSTLEWQMHLSESHIRTLMLAGIIGYALIGAILLFRKNCNRTEVLITVILAAGFIMRIGYMLYTNILQRGHDINGFDGLGHLDYVYRIFANGALPATNEAQFYHPPLQHILQAFVVKIYSLIRPDKDLYSLFEAAKIVPCFATCASLLVCRSICGELKLSPRATVIALAILAFQPTFYLFSSSINNDALMLLFYLIAILYTLRWYDHPSMKHILLLALAIGCGMMTKISAASVAFFTAPVFLIVLVRWIKERRAKPLIEQFAAFLCVSVPLGLWYPVRNLILFGQPLNYVLTIDLPELYCGDQSIVARFFSIPVDQIFQPLYCQPFGDFRLWLYTIKCSVFGEFSFEQSTCLAKLLILANLILMILALVSMVYILLRGRETPVLTRFGLFWIWLVQIVFFVIFNVQFPYGCTMDFRYIVPTAIVGAIYLALALDRIRSKGKRETNILFDVGVAAVALFSVSSILFYVV